MKEFLLYVLNSTICLGVLYLIFHTVMRKETNFRLNRMVLLSLVVISLTIPLLVLPQFVHKTIKVQTLPFLAMNDEMAPENKSVEITESVNIRHNPEKISMKMVYYGYAGGCFISFLILVYGLFSVFMLRRNAEIKKMRGYRLLIINKELPAFSLGRLVFISRRDYASHLEVISAHEKEHMRLNHFYDLIFLEAVKIFQWFNPFIYLLIREMKDIHEFQADNHTLTKGIDTTQYQLLIIQKSVGHQRFALANSFNHCQIKNRIVMMNKQKTGKAWSWKVAAFLPVIALLLLTFCKSGENVPGVNKASLVGTWKLVSYKYGTAKEFTSPDYVAIELITPTHFTWVHYGDDNKVFDSAGGTYVFDGVNFTPNVEFGGKGMVPFFGKSQYKIKIEGDQYFLSGYLISGLKLEEVWKKL